MGLEHQWILVSRAGPGTNSLQMLRENCTCVFDCAGAGAPNSCIVQGSTVFTNKIYIFKFW